LSMDDAWLQGEEAATGTQPEEAFLAHYQRCAREYYEGGRRDVIAANRVAPPVSVTMPVNLTAADGGSQPYVSHRIIRRLQCGIPVDLGDHVYKAEVGAKIPDHLPHSALLSMWR